jgi:tetratricopeptide (TPR) repeat protein
MLNWLGKRLRGQRGETAPRDDAEALVRESLACRQDGRYEEAERYLYRALALAPGAAAIQLHLGDLFRALGRHEAALQCCLEAARLAPDLAQAYNNLGNAHLDLGDVANAVASYRRAIALDAGLAEAHFNLAGALLRTGDARGAADGYREALRHRPEFADAHLNLGFLLEEEGDCAGAIAAYRGALAAAPQLVEAHVNLGMQLLLAGQYAEGWQEYEWRLRYPEYGAAAAGALRWDGTPLAGRTILLDCEQGFGDAIQFLRYAPMVAERGGRVVVRGPSELCGLFAGTPGIAAIVSREDPLPAFDLHCPLPSLPKVFGTGAGSIPDRTPYIQAPADRTAAWKVRLAGGTEERKVGLVWASQSMHRTAPAKSLTLAAMAPLAGVPGLRFFSLQKGEAARQAANPPPGMQIHDLGGELADFSDTAAVLANLDLVISVDTAVAHLAGAMARPAWTLLKFAPDWRWLLARDDCPWYPTMRLFRQPRQGDWEGTIEAVAQALRQFAGAGSGER